MGRLGVRVWRCMGCSGEGRGIRFWWVIHTVRVMSLICLLWEREWGVWIAR